MQEANYKFSVTWILSPGHEWRTQDYKDEAANDS